MNCATQLRASGYRLLRSAFLTAAQHFRAASALNLALRRCLGLAAARAASVVPLHDDPSVFPFIRRALCAAAILARVSAEKPLLFPEERVPVVSALGTKPGKAISSLEFEDLAGPARQVGVRTSRARFLQSCRDIVLVEHVKESYGLNRCVEMQMSSRSRPHYL